MKWLMRARSALTKWFCSGETGDKNGKPQDKA